MSKVIEYRVRPVTRYVVTRFHSEGEGPVRGMAGCETCGEFDNMERANTVAHALHASEPGSTYARLVDPGFAHIGGDSADHFPINAHPAVR